MQTLYICENQIHDFNQYIRIIYRTNLIKNKKENKNDKNNIFINNSINNPVLFNLNMNKIDCYNQNGEKINILFEGIKKTNLTSLDLSSVLKNINNKGQYCEEVNKIVNYLNKELEQYKQALKEILYNKSNEYNEKFNNENIKDFKKFESIILEIINTPNFLYNGIFKEKVDKIISRLNIKNEEEKKERYTKLSSYILSKRKEILLKNKKLILI